jgi:hypothetical protein
MMFDTENASTSACVPRGAAMPVYWRKTDIVVV